MPQDFNPRAVIGDNNPPLSELLPVETEALKERADKLLAGSARAAVTDDDTAGKAVELAKMIGDHIKAIDKARVDRKEPFLVAGREVDAFFKGLAAPLDTARANVVGMIDAYRKEQERKRREEQARIEAELRAEREKREAEERERQAAERRAQEAEAKLAAEREAAERARAEEARRAAEAEAAAKAAGDKAAIEQARAERERAEAEQRARDAEAKAEADRIAKERAERELQAEIAARQAREAEELKAKEAAALAAPTVTRSDYGATASGRKVRSGEITEIRPLLSYLIKANEAGLREALQPLVDRLIKAGLPEIPGVTITTETKTVIR